MLSVKNLGEFAPSNAFEIHCNLFQDQNTVKTSQNNMLRIHYQSSCQAVQCKRLTDPWSGFEK